MTMPNRREKPTWYCADCGAEKETGAPGSKCKACGGTIITTRAPKPKPGA